ncbi:hypothetical protein [Actinoplanes sp. ATCC 53533]|uniref:hypothetical protein n=1 Tax=Actinoplanes sp. ATCC 53533 TaxID=1288362 RepID=UPI0018F5AF4E|nr:hypothetical protein [Actinoplanes sp. ATCC 53533]
MTNWTAAQTAIVVVAVIAVLGSAITAAVTYVLSQRAAQRERQAKGFAEALNAVEDYAELPYRVRRRPGTPEARHQLTEEVSRIQSRLAYHQALLQIEAPCVADKYRLLVGAAKNQAGGQMEVAWRQATFTTDAEMNLTNPYPRGEIDTARDACVVAMRVALRRGRLRHSPAVSAATGVLPAKPASGGASAPSAAP